MASTPGAAEGAARPLALDIDASPIAAAAGVASSTTPVRRGWLYEPKPTDSWCTYLSRPWVLLIVSTYTDLFTLRWWQALFLLVLMGISLLFSFLDINYLVRGPSDYTPTQNRWENTATLGLEYYKRVLFMLSGVASFTGAVSVVMAAKSRFSTYSWGFINIWAFGSFAWANGYAGDAQMNIIFFTTLQVWGVYQWCNHMDVKQATEVRNLKWWGWIITVTGAVGLAAAFYWEIPKFFDAIAGEFRARPQAASACCRWIRVMCPAATCASRLESRCVCHHHTLDPQSSLAGDGTYFYPGVTTPHILDAVASTFNLLGMILMVLRCWEQWLCWIILDCISLGE
jgi:nicotinamide mononucleotide transporter PnuC